MANKRIEYQIGFTADTSQLKKSLNETISVLDNLGIKGQSSLITSLKEGSEYALQLSANLKKATNINTGKLDLTKFNKELSKSGISINEYAQKLISIGPEGKKAFLSVAESVAQAELPMKRTNVLLSKMWTTMQNTVRWQISASVWNSFIGAAQKAYGYAKDLNESLNGIRIVTGQSVKEMKEFAKYANDSARALSTTTTDYTDASLIYFQQGLDEEEVKKRTDVTIKMANAAGVSAQEVSDQLTAVWNNFYDGSKSLEYYADVMVKLGAATASSTDEISQGVEKFAAVANTIGLSYEYATAALATVTAETRQSADVVGTSFRTIFARLQSLKLGEDLEDGTSLGKYSQALATVGVDIKDANGELKNMDVILSELGEKWQTLGKDEQVALAQTVAGQRQYAQLIALMDRWDIFKENLGIAYGSEGALIEQANIYAEGWEAARKRVQAALENIYSSLINEDFFIGLDNFATPLLNGLGDIIDTLGGFEGIIVTLGYVFTTFFQKQVSDGLRNAASATKTFFGFEKKEAANFQQNFLKTTAAEVGNSVGDTTQVKIMQDKVLLQQQYNEKIGNLSEEQQASLAVEKQILELSQEKLLSVAKIVDKVNEEIAAEERLAEINVRNKKSESKNFNTYLGNYLENTSENLYIDSSEKGKIAKLDKKGTNKRTVLNQTQNELKSMVKAQSVTVQYENQLRQLIRTQGNVEKGSKEFENAINALPAELQKTANGANNLEDVYVNLGARTDGLSDLITRLIQMLVELGFGTEEQVQKYMENINLKINKDKELEERAEQAGKKLEEFNNHLNQPPQQDWATRLTSLSNAFFQLSMGLESLNSLIDIFYEKDNMNSGERITRALTSLAMIIPAVVSGYKALTNSKLSEIAVNYIEEKQLITLKKGIIAKTVAEKAETKGLEAKAAAQALSNIYLAAAMALIIAIIAVIKIVNKQREREKELLEENAKKTKEITDASNEELETNRNLVAEMQAALKKYKETGEGKEDLDKKTQALAEAYGIEGAALAQLTGKYSDYEKVLSTANNKYREQIEQNKIDNDNALKAAEKDLISKNSKIRNTYGTQTQTTIGARNYSHQNVKEIEEAKKLGLTTKYSLDIDGGKISDTYKYIYYDKNSAEDILAYYQLAEKMVSYYSQINDNENLSRWQKELSRFSKEEIEAYQEALKNQQKSTALIAAYNTNINVDTIKTYSEYQNWLSEFYEQLNKNGLTDAQEQKNALNNVIANSFNSELNKFKGISEVVSLVKKKNQKLDEDWLNKIFSSDNYNTDILATLDWTQVVSDGPFGSNFNIIYGKTKKYKDNIGSITTATEKLDKVSKATSLLSDSISQKNYEELEKNTIEWGKNGIIEFSQFIQMTLAEQQQYLKNYEIMIAESAARAAKNLMRTAPERINQLNEQIERNKIDAENAAKKIDETSSFIATGRYLIEQQREINAGDEGNAKLSQKQIDEQWTQLAKDFYSTEKDISTFQYTATDKSDEAITRTFRKRMNDIMAEDAGKTADIDLHGDGLDVAETFLNGLEEGLTEDKEKVQMQQELINTKDELQEQLDKAPLEYYINIKVKENAMIESIKNTANQITSIFDKISKDVNSSFDSMGRKVWHFSQETVDAISQLYPEFAASWDSIKNGEYIFTDDVYQEYLDLTNGKIALQQREIESRLDIAIEEKKLEQDRLKEALESAKDMAFSDIENQQQLNQLKQESIIKYNEAAEAQNEYLIGLDAAYSASVDQNTVRSQNVNTNANAILQKNAQNTSDIIVEENEKATQSQDDLTNATLDTAKANNAIGADTETVQAIENEITNNQKNRTASINNRKNKEKSATTETVEDVLKGFDEENYKTDLMDRIQEYYGTVDMTTFESEIAITQAYYKDVIIPQLERALARTNAGISSLSATKAAIQRTIDKSKTESSSETALKDEKIRYHEITKEIEQQDRALQKLEKQLDKTYGDKRFKLLNEQMELLEKRYANQEILNDLIESALAYDKNELIKSFENLDIEVQFDESGELITNYTDLFDKARDEYNAKVTERNQNSKAFTDEQWKVIEESYNRRIEALKAYEETVQESYDAIDKTEELYEQKTQARIAKQTHHITQAMQAIEIRKEVRDTVREWNELIKDPLADAEEFWKSDLKAMNWYDAYGQESLDLLRNYYENRTEEDAKYWDGYRDQALEGLKTSMDGIREYIQIRLSEFENALSQIDEKYSEIISDFGYNKSIINITKELLTLQGVSAKTANGFKILNEANNESFKISAAQTKAQLTYVRNAQERLNQIRKDMSEKELSDIQRKAYEDEEKLLKTAIQTETQNAMASAQEALEALSQLYEDQITNSMAIFERWATNGIGFELLEEKYNRLWEEEERYNDLVNTNYEATKLNNKIENSLLETNSKLAVDKLRSLQREIEMRKENNKLSKYDVDLLNAKYDLTLAQMALEDAQNAKSTVRLVRNASGNWDYQFTADQSSVNDAQQQVDDAQNSLYNLEKNRLKELQDQTTKLSSEMQSELQEALNTYKEDKDWDALSKKTNEIKAKYGNTAQWLLTENNKVKNDLKDLGIDINTAWGGELGSMFNNSAAMLSSFESMSTTLMNNCMTTAKNYSDNTKKFVEDVDLSIDDLALGIKNTALSTDQFTNSAQNLIPELWKEAEAIGALADGYKELNNAKKIYEEEQKGYVEGNNTKINELEGSGIIDRNYVAEVDYYAMLLDAWYENGGKWTDYMATLSHERDNKLAAMGDTEAVRTNRLKKAFEKGEMDTSNWSYDSEKAAQRRARYYMLKKFDTGGYTGIFQGGRLALLHQKELVLNQEDTQNILSAVAAVRSIGPALFQQIERILDANAKAGFRLMSSKLSANFNASMANDRKINQNVVIQADFPGVSSAVEIEAALRDLVNNAAQEASIY